MKFELRPAPRLCTSLSVALVLVITNAAQAAGLLAPPDGFFKFSGKYYYSSLSNGQYCYFLGVPEGVSNQIPSLDPQTIGSTNVGVCLNAEAPVGFFQFAGSYYYNNPTNHQYCLYSGTPQYAANLPIIDPQRVGNTNVGMCSVSGLTPLPKAGYYSFQGFDFYYNGGTTASNNGYCLSTQAPAGAKPVIDLQRVVPSGNDQVLAQGVCTSAKSKAVSGTSPHYFGYYAGSRKGVGKDWVNLDLSGGLKYLDHLDSHGNLSWIGGWGADGVDTRAMIKAAAYHSNKSIVDLDVSLFLQWESKQKDSLGNPIDVYKLNSSDQIESGLRAFFGGISNNGKDIAISKKIVAWYLMDEPNGYWIKGNKEIGLKSSDLKLIADEVRKISQEIFQTNIPLAAIFTQDTDRIQGTEYLDYWGIDIYTVGTGDMQTSQNIIDFVATHLTNSQKMILVPQVFLPETCRLNQLAKLDQYPNCYDHAASDLIKQAYAYEAYAAKNPEKVWAVTPFLFQTWIPDFETNNIKGIGLEDQNLAPVLYNWDVFMKWFTQ